VVKGAGLPGVGRRTGFAGRWRGVLSANIQAMNNLALGAATAESEEIVQLRERVRALEIRLERIEQREASAVSPGEPDTALPPSMTSAALGAEIAAATIFKRIAMLGFALLGALILRVLTQENILGARLGTVLGFAYTGQLIVWSLIPGRFGGFARESSLLPCSGAVLAYFIAMESALRTLTLGRAAGMIAIAGFGLLALAMGIRQRKAPLAGTGVIGGTLALVALDLRGTTVALQLGLFVLLAAAGISSSWRAGWGWLRRLTTFTAMLLLPAGFFFCGNEPGVAGGLLSASAAVWCLIVVQHVLAFRRLGLDSVWLPLATLWLAGIQYLAHWPALGATNGAIAAAGLAAVIIWGRRASQATAGLAGMMATAAFAGALGWVMLDPTGLLCAVGGLGLWFAGRRAASDWAAVFATLLMLAAMAAGLAQLLQPPLAPAGLAAMSLSALVLVIHYMSNGRAGGAPYSGLPMRLAPIALAAGLALLLGFFWELLNRFFVPPAHLLLSQTVMLVITALALTFWGHAARRRAPLVCGLACMALALGKVLVIDLIQLKSLNMLASLVLVSLASVAVSVILRRRA
jgi:hypothetical protein